MSCSIHPCPWLHLQLAVACCYLASKLLNNVVVSLLKLSSVCAMCFDLCHAIFLVLPPMHFCELCAECIKLAKQGTCCCYFARQILLYLVAMLTCCYKSFSALFGRCSLRMFCYTCYALSIHAPGCIYRLLQLVVILLQSC